MNSRRTAWMAGVSAFALVLTACGSSSNSGSSTSSAAATGAATSAGTDTGSAGETTGGGGGASSGAELVIWADNSANTAKAIEPLCLQWAEENGVTCTVKKFNGGGPLQDALTSGNATGDVPDLFEAAADSIGSNVQNGILAPIDLASNKDKFSDVAVQAVVNGGATYGVPWAVENIALFTNKTLAPECPATMDDAVANAKSLIAAGKATAGLGIAMQISTNGDFYHWYPLFTADGGYAFKQNPDGSFDPKDMGIGKEGSIAAATKLQQLVNDGIFQASVTYDIALESFNKGTSPYMISGPWSVPQAKTALGDNMMICPVPPWAGSTLAAQPFVGTRTFMQPAKAKNPTLASTFLNDEVMTTAFMDGMFAVDPRPPAWLESYEKAAKDPIVKAFGEYGKQGVPIPGIPQMATVFTEGGLAMYKVASGSDPTATMTEAGASINKQIGN